MTILLLLNEFCWWIEFLELNHKKHFGVVHVVLSVAEESFSVFMISDCIECGVILFCFLGWKFYVVLYWICLDERQRFGICVVASSESLFTWYLDFLDSIIFYCFNGFSFHLFRLFSIGKQIKALALGLSQWALFKKLRKQWRCSTAM